jgi:hypothetical protein
MLIFIGGFVGLVYQRQPVLLLPLLGAGRPLLLQPGGLLVHQPRGGQRRAQGAADDAHCGLRPAGGHPGHSVSPHGQRTLDRSQPWRTAFTGGIFVLMLVALVAKSVQFPLHTWIPEAMAAPTPVSALLHAACYVKAGVYLACAHAQLWRVAAAGGFGGNDSLVWVGTVTMAVGVMYAMVQTDLKRMLAFSTVSQIGYMMMGLGIGTPLAITAGLLHCLNHGFFKGGLFPDCGLGAARLRHARHEPAGRPGAADAAHDAVVA